MSAICYEIVTYEVGEPTIADAARQEARSLLKTFSGFIAWSEFSGIGDPAVRVDLVAWRNVEDAKAAARAVEGDPLFAAFRASVNRVIAMGHYNTMPAGAHPVGAGAGLEVGRFRLKSGVDETTMRQAYAAMVDRHLSLQPGWRRQHLVKLADGVFIDLAFADSQERAQAICAGWQGNAACDAFLALVDPVSMEFGTVT